MSKERDDLIRKTKMAKAAILFDKTTSRVINIILILALIIIGAALFDMLNYTLKGLNGIQFHDFDELLRQNPDTVAWIQMNGTHINYPVVQGKDNFEYLDLDFNRNFYMGGTLFLDCKNKRDLSDNYNIIHGHHMAGGAMFGDLEKYLDQDFFEKNSNGVLLTPTKNYRLTVIGSGLANAYDLTVYNVESSRKVHFDAMDKVMHIKRNIEYKKEKIVVLSTCTDDIDDSRIVVFCVAKEDPELESITDPADNAQ